MSKITYLSSNELITTVDVGKEEENPTRKLKLCSCGRPGKDYAVVVEILGKKIALAISDNEDEARTFFNLCLDVIPCFWSPKVVSQAHLSEIFDEAVLTQLVELIKTHGSSWSVAHMCISLPLQEDTIILLLASDAFKHYFCSDVHPKKYRLLHLAVEQKSVVACKAIMRCSDCWLSKDPGLYAVDADGNTPIEKAVLSQSMACLEYLLESWVYTQDAEPAAKRPALDSKVDAEPAAKRPALNSKVDAEPAAKRPALDSKFSLKAAVASSFFVNYQQVTDTRLHDLIKKKLSGESMAEKQRQIVELLVEKMYDPNGRIGKGMTPLHLAVEGRDIHSARALIAFDANAQLVNDYGETPLDMAKRHKLEEMYDLLHLSCLSGSSHMDGHNKRNPRQDQASMLNRFADNTNHLHIGRSPNGDRVLCLDGGGIKGLILVDMLMTIERIANKRIVELFDWIIGTSTGGILALAIVYADLSLGEIRRIYFDLKKRVFIKKTWNILLPDTQTEILESILKEKIGKSTTLGEKTHPRVLITATDMQGTPMKLVFFNNYENGMHGKDQYVWAAAQATSAAPFYFKQHEYYADGGLKANNPSMSGLTTIHEYYTGMDIYDYKICVVASLGCGKFYKEMGELDADIRQHIANIAELNNVPNHLRHLNVIKAWSTVKQGCEGFTNLFSSLRGFLYDVLLAEITECNEEPVRIARALCESRRGQFYRLSPELDMSIELDENDDEKLVDMLITTKRYVQANIARFRRIVELTQL